MANTEILQAVSTDTGTNLLTQAEYLADSQRPIGNQPGIARAKFVNKMLRQLTTVAAAFAKYIADRQATDVTDALTPTNLALYLHTALNNSNVATVVGGTVDAISLTFAPVSTTLQKGIIQWKSSGANTVVAPTLARDAQAAKTIVKGNNLPLAPGDITGTMFSVYDSVLDKEVLLNPATGVAGSGYTQLSSGAQSVAANALTVSMDPGAWDFRNVSLPSAQSTKGTLSATASVVVPAGATLGTVNAIQSCIAVLLILPTGLPPEVAVINFTGGTNLDQSGVISTTAISAGATSPTVAYSTTARANVPYRLERLIISTQATAGQWASAPTQSVPVGGQPFNAMSSLGYGSNNVAPGKSFGVTYTNGARPRLVSASGTGNSAGIQVLLQATVTSPTGVAATVGSGSVYSPSAGYGANITFLVPPYHQYIVNASGGSISLTVWNEI